MDQVSLIEKLTNCIDDHKVIKLQIEWLDGIKEDILFETYLIGESIISKWNFIYGRAPEKEVFTYIPVHYIVSFEKTGDSFLVSDKNKTLVVYCFENNKIIKTIPDINVCELFEIKDTILNYHAEFKIITQNDKELSKDFSQIKGKEWVEEYFELKAEWSETPNHGGDLNFTIKSTTDQKYWALFWKELPTEIYAVAEMIKGGEIVMENVAATMMSAFTFYERKYIDVINSYGDVNFELLMDLYGNMTEK